MFDKKLKSNFNVFIFKISLSIIEYLKLDENKNIIFYGFEKIFQTVHENDVKKIEIFIEKKRNSITFQKLKNQILI